MSDYPSYLIHYGIQGQKWGVRRFQNEDGTYTSEGLERRRQGTESYASNREIRRATKEGKQEAKYNEALAKQQKAINRRFDKVTGKIERDKSEGKEISQRRINKAVKLGTEFRKRDYIAKDPSYYYSQMEGNRKATATATLAGTVLFGVPSGIASGLLTSAVNSQISRRNLDKYYEKVFEQARNETIKDLKKHKIM